MPFSIYVYVIPADAAASPFALIAVPTATTLGEYFWSRRTVSEGLRFAFKACCHFPLIGNDEFLENLYILFEVGIFLCPHGESQRLRDSV